MHRKGIYVPLKVHPKGIGGLYEGHKRKRRRRGAEMSFLEKWWVVVGKKRKQTHYITG